MLTSKSSKTLLAIAASAIMSQVSLAACNCSVPPAPAAAGVVPQAAWGNGGYAGYGGAYYGYSPGSMSAVASGYGPGVYGSYGAGAYGMGGYAPGVYGTGGGGPGGGGPVGGNTSGYVGYEAAGPFWGPGGYEARLGSPVYYHDPSGGQYVNSGNPYYDHFGPGFHRSSLYGHYRFPYYNYRAPWYFPGKAVYNRDTNFAW